MTDPAALYLELLKRTLTGMVYEDPPMISWETGGLVYQEETRVNGTDWPSQAPTMVGLARLDHLQWCVEQVLADDVPGDLAECGVWRGGSCIFMRALLRLHGITDRTIWVIDSFAGLPEADRVAEEFGVKAVQDLLAVSLGQVRHNFRLYGLLDDQVLFLEGRFADTLPGSPVGPLAVLRCDGDLYSSTTDTLESLYPKLSPGGFVIIDDWQLTGAHRAVLDYREKHGINEPVTPVPGSRHVNADVAAFWRKE